VSETTAEIFSDVGIARIFGKPRLLEVVVGDDRDDPSGLSIKPLKEEVGDRWPGDLLIDVPNLSLNKGIKRRHRFWFYIAACIGCGLQIGTSLPSAHIWILIFSSYDKVFSVHLLI
jgi:hypothetical protein